MSPRAFGVGLRCFAFAEIAPLVSKGNGGCLQRKPVVKNDLCQDGCAELKTGRKEGREESGREACRNETARCDGVHR